MAPFKIRDEPVYFLEQIETELCVTSSTSDPFGPKGFKRVLESCDSGLAFDLALQLSFSFSSEEGSVLRVRALLLRKEVIQPQVPLRLPCYDFIPITGHTLGTRGHFGYNRLS